MGRFEGKVAVITGGARGQGRSHALALAREGADVVVADVPAPIASVPYPLATSDDLAETVAMVEEVGVRAVGIPTDVRKSADIDAVIATAISEFGKIDVLVANAGIVSYSPLIDMDDDTWLDMINVNLTGVAWTIRAALPHMADRSYGRIVVTASQAARRGMPNLAHYCSAKWGLLGLVKTVALEMAPHLGVTCNAVLPGGVDTPMMRNDAVCRVFAPDWTHRRSRISRNGSVRSIRCRRRGSSPQISPTLCSTCSAMKHVMSPGQRSTSLQPTMPVNRLEP
ncbi:mycofactocin-coupled SDR family oxidoreductase [Nocardia brevicatena]|uniref:mycofactocin-coupled SDR family oxidoreductase n=1 Tax=Nocardia brevicatena TaxID=37327 RepID=UPI0002F42B46|nr:mycofactocin-coupled SDR family oxidoreductase [Nocardia brevicatena]